MFENTVTHVPDHDVCLFLPDGLLIILLEPLSLFCWFARYFVFCWQRRSSWIFGSQPTAKAFSNDVFINHKQKLGNQMYYILADSRFFSVSTLWAIRSLCWAPGGVCTVVVARLKNWWIDEWLIDVSHFSSITDLRSRHFVWIHSGCWFGYTFCRMFDSTRGTQWNTIKLQL